MGLFSKKTPKELFKEGESEILKNNDIDKGIILIRKAIKNDPSLINHAYNFAFQLHASARKYNRSVGGNIYYSEGLRGLDPAIAILELLAELQPESGDVWLCLGLAYDNRCYFDKAINAYGKSAIHDKEGPDGADALLNLGILYFNQGKGILGVKAEDLINSTYVFDLTNEYFYKAEEMALKAAKVWKNVFLKDASFRGELIKAHMLNREIYSVFAKQNENNDGSILLGTKALEHCLEIYKLNPNDEDAISWLKQAEKNTGGKYL